MKTKICSKCKFSKPFSEYFKDSRRVIGIRCRCKECCRKDTMSWRKKNKSQYNNYIAFWRSRNPTKQHATDIKRHYGLTGPEYEQLLKDQNNSCWICLASHNPDQKRGRLYVDHDHKTGKVRGLLCGGCNSALGHFKDNVEILEKAIQYLKKQGPG